MNKYSIAVHIGAGYHSHSKESEYNTIIELALQTAASFAESCGSSALDVVEAAMNQLEKSPLLNSGIGSNLCIDGTVECDATVVECRQISKKQNSSSTNNTKNQDLTNHQLPEFASIGAVPGVSQPSKVVCTLLKQSRLGNFSLGRLRPL